MRSAAGLVMALVCSAAFATEPVQRSLSFDDRVKAQSAIERVYYSHQLGTTKSFSDAVPRAVLESKVRKYLEQSAALNTYWKTAVTDYTLQRELERMAQGTKMPERLLELYAALGNDPFLIKECLARPALVDRLTHNFYAFDPAQHVKARGQADALHQLLVSGALSPSAEHTNRTVTELVVSETEAGPSRPEQASRQRLTLADFQKKRAELPTSPGQVSEISESRDAYTFNVILSETPTNLRVANYVVPKTTWDTWWEVARRTARGDAVMAVASGRVDLPVPRLGGAGAACADDGWDNGVLDDLPAARLQHSSVWTGSEMVVWGGQISFGVYTRTGGRYNPATDTWTPTSTVGAPWERGLHTAVWTGSLMVVWGGGQQPGADVNTGGRYDPLTDSWTTTAIAGAPSARDGHTAVWTGNLMLIWGGEHIVGFGGLLLNTGARYDPSTDSWTPISTTGAPSARGNHTAVWTGSLMVVWGGVDTHITSSGGRYDPSTDSWSPTSFVGAPDARVGHSAVWTGTRMVVWGGKACVFHDPPDLVGPTSCIFDPVDTGARYDPVADTWAATSTIDAPFPRAGHSAVWTGSVMLLWGGNTYSSEGGRYDPATDAWTPMSRSGEPSAREHQTAVWTGNLMVVWGGQGPAGSRSVGFLNTGGRYDAVTDSWTPTSMTSAPSERSGHTAVWTGNSMVVWGGVHNSYSGDTYLDTGGRYDPTIDDWTPTSTIGAPSMRAGHAAVWTGNVMVVWSGYFQDGAYHTFLLNSGGRYDATTDSWTPMSVTDAPNPRSGATATWTGSLMVAWGGGNELGPLSSGGRYDPEFDSWAPTSTAGGPSARYEHTAVWTGSLMVVWGGYFVDSSNHSTYLDSGGRYDAATDTWTPTSATGAPSARAGHTAVLAGNKVVVWGGRISDSSNSLTNTGGRYDAESDTWNSASTIGAPTVRSGHTAVSTGNLMIVRGGVPRDFTSSRAGGWYDPVTDHWTKISMSGDPVSVGGSTVWTGNAMIVWTGSSGGRYSLGTSLDEDCDGDGLSSSAGDCDDHVASVYPGAPQLCDGINNDCSSPAWPLATTEDDFDQDGFRRCQGDCNDFDATVYPGAPQLCDGINNDCSDPAPPSETDNDFDGYRTCQGDCDDTNRFVYPGAYDFCDGRDNDCDGIIDNLGDALCHSNVPCYDFTCGGSSGCIAAPNTAACDDGNACTSGDVCGGGECHGAPLNGDPCDDGNVCTTNDVCGNSSCHGTPTVGNACDDGDSCTTDDTCADGWCGGTPVECDDGNRCNGLEYCYNGYGCVAGTPPPACNDGNNCTDDACDPAIGCVFSPNTNACNDGRACTSNDSCVDGSCRGTPRTGDACDDGDACTTSDACGSDGTCHGGPPLECSDGDACNGIEICYPDYGCYSEGSLDCNDGNLCTTDGCNPVIGCTHVNTSDPCNDHNLCTSGDTCSGGNCSGTPVVCNDHNLCTTDVCNPATGCAFTSDPNACNDHNPCTDDACDAGTGTCSNVIDDRNTCSDGNFCTSTDTCRGGICTGADPVDCSAGCPAGFEVVGGLCQYSYDIDASLLDNQNTYCDDQGRSRFNDCNGQNYGFHWTDIGRGLIAIARVDLQLEPGVNCGGSFSGLALNGVPVGGFAPDDNCDCESIQGAISFPGLDVGAYAMAGFNVISIAPGSVCEGLSTNEALGGAFARITVTYVPHDHTCQVGVCDPGTGACNFSSSPDGAECSDGNACTTGDSCIDGACNGTALDCDDHNLCTDDSCDPAFGCVTVRAPAGRSCDDHNACDGTEACDAYGTCVSSNAPQCDDHVVCTEDSCDPLLGCVYQPYPAGTSCADGNACNGVEQCDGAGQCAPGFALDCDDLSLCSQDYCDPLLGCQHAPYPAGTSCSDGNACNGIEVCTGTTLCPRALPPNCDDNNPCTDDSCNPATGCVHTNNTGSCNDGNACTTLDVCGGGTCNGGTPLACDDNNPCTDDSCDPAEGCVHTNSSKLCDDGDACTAGDTCGGGTCHGGAPIKCGDGNACTTDSCDPAIGCVFTNNANACDDGNACTTGDHCAGGSCGAGSPVTCSALDQCHTAGACNPATGTCSNPPKPNGSVCDDTSLCTTGETCQSGTCTPASSGLNEPNPRTNGYYKRLCQGPHSGDQFRDTDATCVASVAPTFAGISTVADICAVLQPSHPNSDPCGKTEDDLMVLALNICRARVCTAQNIDSQCGGNGSVGQSLAESDDILRSETRDGTSCAHAKCLDEEINTGRALEMNTLMLRREGSGVRLDWRPPYLDDGTGHPSKYNVWRRAQGSLAAFTKIGTTAEATFVDSLATSGTFEYEVTAVMNP